MTFAAALEKDPDGTWYYVHVPKEIRDGWKQFERRGTIRVHVTIGGTSWAGSMLPWADGSAQISVNKKVRARENLELGQLLKVEIELR